MEVDETQAKDRSSYQGQTYFFCSTACREEFDEAPEDYLGGEDTTLKTGT